MNSQSKQVFVKSEWKSELLIPILATCFPHLVGSSVLKTKLSTYF